jgi:multisite-specific tRNA:(cytosine-C5)-methyltransferase
MYLTNDIVKDIIQSNDYTRIRLTMAGVKVFTRQEAGKGGESQFRIFGEALPVGLPYIEPSSIIDTDISTLKTLLEGYFPLCSSFEEPFKSLIEGRGKSCSLS